MSILKIAAEQETIVSRHYFLSIIVEIYLMSLNKDMCMSRKMLLSNPRPRNWPYNFTGLLASLTVLFYLLLFLLGFLFLFLLMLLILPVIAVFNKWQ